MKLTRHLGYAALSFFAIALGIQVMPLQAQERGSDEAQHLLEEKMRASPELLQRYARCTTIDQRRQVLDSLRSHAALIRKQAGGSVHINGSFANGQVSSPGDNGSEMHAAINPKDSNNMVCSAMMSDDFGGLAFPIYYTRDGGKTWAKSSFAPAPPDLEVFILGGGDPMFAFDADGKLYFSWIDLFFSLSSAQPPMVMYWASSTDGGESWERNAKSDSIASGYINFADMDNSPLVDKQWMMCDQSNSAGRNNLYASLLLYYPSDQRVAMRMKGATEPIFRSSFLRPISKNYSFNQFTSIDCDDEGRVHMSYVGALPTDSMPLGEYRLYHMLSNDQGSSFQPEVQVSTIRFLNSLPGDQTSTEAPVGMSRVQALPQIACDKYSASAHHGNVYLAWTALGTNSRGSRGLDIYFSRSTDHGSTWSTPIIINDDASLSGGKFSTQAYVSMTVSPTGVVVMSWYDFREDAENRRAKYYMTYSFDGGKTFIKNFAVSSMPTDFKLFADDTTKKFGMGEYNQVVCSKGYAMPFWGDARNGERKIYTAKIPIIPNPESAQAVSTQCIDDGIQLDAPQPSPAHQRATLLCHLNSDRVLRVEIVDALGRSLQEVQEMNGQLGSNTIHIDCSNLPSGLAFVRVLSGNAVLSHALVVQH